MVRPRETIFLKNVADAQDGETLRETFLSARWAEAGQWSAPRGVGGGGLNPCFREDLSPSAPQEGNGHFVAFSPKLLATGAACGSETEAGVPKGKPPPRLRCVGNGPAISDDPATQMILTVF